MNKREMDCVVILTDLTENYGLIGVKTSFEDEGAMFNEVIRLKQICNEAKVKITLKIGGPEAIRDLKDSIIIGVKGIVAPMVESSFGVEKFLNATKKHIPQDILNTVQLGINLETITALNTTNMILSTKNIKDIHSITIGRVDLVSSMGKDRSYVNSNEIYELTKQALIKAKSIGLKCCVGGAISINSIDFLSRLYSDGLLDKFETRNIIFDPSLSLKQLSKALMKAQLFEYTWMINKNEYYSNLANQDLNRIKMIQDRLNQSSMV